MKVDKNQYITLTACVCGVGNCPQDKYHTAIKIAHDRKLERLFRTGEKNDTTT